MNSLAGETVPESEVTSMLDEADTNGDGFVDLDEFITVMKKHKNR